MGIDEERLKLEKRRFHRESLSLGIAIGALAVSIVATIFAVQPIIAKPAERSATVQGYLAALSTSGVNDALSALAYAESGSPAASFATTVSLWRQAQRDNTGEVADGDVRSTDGGYELCLPALDVPLFPESCIAIGNIDFSETGELRDFTIDGIPTASLVRTADESTNLTDGGHGPMRVHAVAGVVAPDASTQTLIYGLRRTREADRQYDVRFSAITLHDDREQRLEPLAQHFPETVGYWEQETAVIQVPYETTFLLLCWDGVQDDRGNCDWTYGTGMR